MIGTLRNWRVVMAEPGGRFMMTTPTMTPAGWYPDPSQRHDYRYWDGTGWSSQVSDGGLTTADPELRPATTPAAAPTVGPLAPPAPDLAAPAEPRSAAPAAARAARWKWAVPLVAIIAVIAVIAGLMIWSTRAPTATTLYQQMRKNAAAAKSVHIKGAFTDAGQKLQIDIAGDRGGKNTRGIVNDGTGEVEILIAGGKTYVKADAAFWTKNASAEVATLAAGKYLVVPTGSAAGTAGFEVGTLLDQIFAQDMTTLQSLNTKVAKTEVNGIPAYLMTDRIGSDGSKIYVSADGRARLLRLESPKAQGSLDFTQWDAVPPVSAPPADQLAKIPGM